MLDILFFVILQAVFFSIGAVFVNLLLPERLQLRWFIAPTIGYGLVSVIITLLYRYGMMMDSIFFVVLGLAGAGLAWVAWRAWTIKANREANALRTNSAMLLLAIWLIAALVLLAPQWTGHNRFSVFQGNQWDTFGYLNSAVVYAKVSYAKVLSATDADMLKDPLLAYGQVNLGARPSVHLLYSCMGKFFPRHYHDLYYTFLIVLLAQAALVALFLFRNLFPAASVPSLTVVALVLPFGFWGQYVFDINSWSQLSSVAILFLICSLCILAYAHREMLAAWSAWRTSLLFAIVFSGALYLYPESMVFHIPAFLAIIAALVIRSIRRGGSRSAVAAMLAGMTGGLATGFLFYKGIIGFVMGQYSFATTTNVEWWRFFMAYLFGRDGVNEGFLANTVDALGSVFGLYFLTPGPGQQGLVAIVARVVIISIIAGLVMSVYHMARIHRAEPVRSKKHKTAVTSGTESGRDALYILLLFIGVLLLGSGYLLSLGKFWSMNKSLSYLAPYLMMLLMMPVLSSRNLPAVSNIALAAFVVLQIGLGPVRVLSAGEHNGVHYAFPYPSCQEPPLKQFDWDLSRIARDVERARLVGVDIKNRWIENYIMVYLYSLDKPFVLLNTVNTYFGAGRDLGLPPAALDVDALIAFDTSGTLQVLPRSR